MAGMYGTYDPIVDSADSPSTNGPALPSLSLWLI